MTFIDRILDFLAADDMVRRDPADVLYSAAKHIEAIAPRDKREHFGNAVACTILWEQCCAMPLVGC